LPPKEKLIEKDLDLKQVKILTDSEYDKLKIDLDIRKKIRSDVKDFKKSKS